MFPNAVDIHSIPNRHLLVPNDPHPAQVLTDGLLLCEDGVSAEGIRICAACFLSLKNSLVPRNALAGGKWLGDIPPELACLTLVEKILIGRGIPRMKLIKLQPKKKHLPDHLLNTAFTGNVCTFDMPHPDLESMISGHYLPHPPSILPDLVSVAFVGPGKAPPSYLKGILGVSRSRLVDALICLRECSPEYSDIVIDRSRLALFPIDGLPNEIIVRDDIDPIMAEFEGMGYVPDKDGEDSFEFDITVDAAEDRPWFIDAHESRMSSPFDIANDADMDLSIDQDLYYDNDSMAVDTSDPFCDPLSSDVIFQQQLSAQLTIHSRATDHSMYSSI